MTRDNFIGKTKITEKHTSLKGYIFMKIAVVTPYYKESIEILKKCHESVLAQTYEVSHVMVADGHYKPEIDEWDIEHVILPKAHHDNGSTPRLIGSYHAIGLEYDAIAYLDADNWFDSGHIENLVRLHETTNALFLSSSRVLCRIDGSIMGDCEQTDPDKFIDTSCMMFVKGSFNILDTWGLMPKYIQPLCDRVVFQAVKKSGVKRAHSEKKTMFFRCVKAGIYMSMGEVIPEGVLDKPDYKSMHKRWLDEGNAPIL